MTVTLTSCLYPGEVIHKRLRPKAHAMRYRVFSLLVDVDQLGPITRRLKLLSYNRFNLFSINDRDHGAGDRRPLADQARAALAEAGIETGGGRIALLCYPRVLGYVFNPLSVFFCFDREDALAAVIYEVSNTFGERKSYVIPAGAEHNGTYAHGCRKELFVSPFASGSGQYSFRVTRPAERVVVSVNLRDTDGPLIKTHFRGDAVPLTDRALFGLWLRFPVLTFKVIAAIHFEAAKLWFKGIPLVRGHRSPRYSVSTTHTAQVTGQS